MRQRFARTLKSGGALAVIDQAAVSAGNFGTSVLLARTLDQTSFGIFVLATAVPLLILQVQYGLLLSPLTLNGAAMSDEKFRAFVKANAVLQLAFTLISCVIVGCVLFLWESLQLRSVLVPLLLLSALWQIQEFCRRVLYTRGQIRAALINNIVNYDVQVVAIAAGVVLSSLGVEGALWISVATSAAAVVLGAWQLRTMFGGPTANLRQTAREIFDVGKWTAGAAALIAAGHQSTPFFIAIVDGVPGAAVMGVLYQLIGPVHLLGRPLQNYFTPLAVRALAHEGSSGLRRVMRQAVLITGPGYIGYTLLLTIVPSFVLTIVYANKYTDFADALRIFAIMELLAFAELVLILELSARRMQKQVFYGWVVFIFVLYTLGWYLTKQASVRGLVWALTAATIVQIVFYGAIAIRARAHDAIAGKYFSS